MKNKIMQMINFFTVIVIVGCSSPINEKVDFPFEVINTIPSPKNKDISIIIIKTGIKGGATVPFEYEFYFSKNDETLSRNKLFLWLRGLENYKINWTSANTIDIDINASRVIMFQSDILIEEDTGNLLEYYVNNLSWNRN